MRLNNCRLVGIGVLVATIGAHAADSDDLRRLGNDVVPRSQTIELDLDPRQADYTGTVVAVVDVNKAVSTFRLHAEEMEIRTVAMTHQGSGGAPIALIVSAIADGQIEVRSTEPIPKGRYTLRIEFSNNFDTEAKGLYRLHVGGEWYAFTQFEAVDAREAFPCWDEPAFKIPYQMTLTVPAEQAVITNMPEASAKTKDGKRTIVFAATPPLPSYLLAIVAGPLEFVPIPGTSIPSRVVTTKGQSKLAGQAVAMTPPILAALERYFGSRHPYPKMDLVGVPEYWYGAMENPGAITYVDRALLLDPKSVDAASRGTLAVYTAHEIAHMWFGDLVTMAWWDDLWLNESFATWLEDKITAEVFPELNAEISRVKAAQRAMETDGQLATRALRQPVRSMDSLLQSADALAYNKGSAVLHMTEDWLGRETFRKGVLAFVKAHANANATADDLWNAVGAASGKNVKGVLASFLDQPGVPLVSVEPLGGGRVRLRQTRFLAAGLTPPGPQVWQIPVALRYPKGGSTTVKRVLLTQPEQIVALGGETPAWVHPNADEAGYYRWSVPSAVFATMADEGPAKLTARERVGFLGNASALLEAGQLSGKDYARVLAAFASDSDPEIVGTVIAGIHGLRDTFYSQNDDPAFASFVRRTLAPALARFGIAKREGEPEAVTLLRGDLVLTLGDLGHDDAVLAEMDKVAASYLSSPASVDPSIAGPALRLSAIRGDAARFDLYRTRFEASQVPVERRRFLDALGWFRDPALIDRGLAYALDGPLRPQEVMTIPRVVAQLPAYQPRVYAWMTAHYDQIASRLPADFMVFMPYFAAGCSSQRLNEAQAFFRDTKHAPPGTSTELAKVSEAVGVCVALDAREGEAVRSYVAGSPGAR